MFNCCLVKKKLDTSSIPLFLLVCSIFVLADHLLKFEISYKWFNFEIQIC